MAGSSQQAAVAVLLPETDCSVATALADELQLPLVGPAEPDGYDALLQFSAEGLQLQPLGPGASGPVMVDFGSAGMRHRRRGGQQELLGRAVGAGKRDELFVVDATAGLGRDSFVLADSGCRVLMMEQSGVVHALLRDGLKRALDSPDAWLSHSAQRLRLVRGEAGQLLAGLDTAPDVVYLDPMFPERRKSARVKKEMWLFQHLLGQGYESPGLLDAALDSAQYRVVVKRPLKAPPMDGRQAGFSLRGKAVRYDVYGLRKLA